MRRFTFSGLVAATVVAVAFPLLVVMACGPDFQPEVFVPANHPSSPARFAEGRLGVLQREYYHADLVVAYRYLHGGRLSVAERAVYNPPPELGKLYTAQNWQTIHDAQMEAEPSNQWRTARAAFAADAGPSRIGRDKATDQIVGNYVVHVFELNCTDGAFETAIATLQARAKTWGPASAELKEWIRGQDAVFANCAATGTLPSEPRPEWNALLRQDRAYQIAAAQFYSGDFDDAVKGFEAVGRDAASPWSQWGEYLAARAEVRKAAATAKVVDEWERAEFDPDLLQAAQTRLKHVEQTTKDAAVRHAADAELAFIQVRLDPSGRLDAVGAALAGPGPDQDFEQHLIDLNFLLDHPAKDWAPQSNGDLVRWIEAWQTGAAKWRSSEKSLPWLVVSLATAHKDDAETAELMAAAAKVPPESPGYVTANFHRVRLMLASGKREDARKLATTVLAGLGKDDSGTRNALLEERMPTARTLEEFLADVPRVVIDAKSEAADLAKCTAWSKTKGCLGKLPEMQIDGDGAAAFNRQLPLATWVTAAQGTTLPENLRQGVAWAAWLRALALGDDATVKRLAPMLPEPVRKTAGDSDGFPATLALLDNPGLRPYLQQGTQRSVSFGVMDSFRDNWWCGRWGDGVVPAYPAQQDLIAAKPEPLFFLSAKEGRVAMAEVALLNKLPIGTVWLGQRAVAYVKAHPQDKDGAEALALTVRATHYACSGQNKDPAQQAVSKEAFEMLHRLYPKSTWAEKTQYYY